MKRLRNDATEEKGSKIISPSPLYSSSSRAQHDDNNVYHDIVSAPAADKGALATAAAATAVQTATEAAAVHLYQQQQILASLSSSSMFSSSCISPPSDTVDTSAAHFHTQRTTATGAAAPADMACGCDFGFPDEDEMPALVVDGKRMKKATHCKIHAENDYSDNDGDMPPLISDGKKATQKSSNKTQQNQKSQSFSHSSPLLNFPNELLHTIISYVDATTLCSLDASCTQFYKLTPSHWKIVTNRRFGNLCKYTQEYKKSSYGGKLAWKAGMNLIGTEGRVFVPLSGMAPRNTLCGGINHGFSSRSGNDDGYSRFVAIGSDDHQHGLAAPPNPQHDELQTAARAAAAAQMNRYYPNITLSNDEQGGRGANPITIRDMNNNFHPVGCIDSEIGAWSLAILGKEGEEIVVNSMGNNCLNARRLFPPLSLGEKPEYKEDDDHPIVGGDTEHRKTGDKQQQKAKAAAAAVTSAAATNARKRRKVQPQSTYSLKKTIHFNEFDASINPQAFDGSQTEGMQLLATSSVLLVSRAGMFHLFIPDETDVLKKIYTFDACCANVVDLKWTASEFGENCFACCTDPGVVKVWKIVPTGTNNDDGCCEVGHHVHTKAASSFLATAGVERNETFSSVESRSIFEPNETPKQSPFIIVPVTTIHTDCRSYFKSFVINDRFLAAPRGRACITVYDVSTGQTLHHLHEPESEYLDEEDDEYHTLGIENNGNNNGGGGNGEELNHDEHEENFTPPLSMYSQGEILVSSSMLGAAVCVWDMAGGVLIRRHSDIFRRDGFDNWLTSQHELPDGNDVTCLSPILGGNALLLSVFGGSTYLFGFPMNEAQRNMFHVIREREMDVIRDADLAYRGNRSDRVTE